MRKVSIASVLDSGDALLDDDFMVEIGDLMYHLFTWGKKKDTGEEFVNVYLDGSEKTQVFPRSQVKAIWKVL